MEHLIDDNKPAPLRVPYIATQYDGGDFLTFPQRAGWDTSAWEWVAVETEDLNLSGRSVLEVSSFLQTWLFFGLLESFFGGQVASDEFLSEMDDQGLYINTRTLKMHVEAWRTNVTILNDEVERGNIQEKLYSNLQKASDINSTLSYILYYGTCGEDLEPLAATLFVQKLLMDAIYHVAQDVLGVRNVSSGMFYDVYLEKKLLGAGWCSKTVEYMQKNLPLQVQTYAFALGSVRQSHQHHLCSSKGVTECQLNKMTSDFRPKHVKPNCSCISVSAPLDQVVSLLQQGLIPIMTIKSSPESPGIELLIDGIDLDHPTFQQPYEGCPYLAFSHVWSDGLGNPHDNSLPQCQLERLGNAIRSMIGRETWAELLTNHHGTTAKDLGTISFWFDTLCIPVKPEHQNLRDYSVHKMHEIYRKSAGVVVLDPDIQNLEPHATNQAVLTRALCSIWKSRLWTYQEAALAKYLHFPVRGSTFTLSTSEAAYGLEPCSSDLIEQQLLDVTWKRYCDLVWDSKANFLVDTNPSKAVVRMLRATTYRRTTRKGDETIVFATFLRLDVRPLLQACSADRMPLLLRLIPAIPAELLFTYGPRLQEKGFRWAPQTFLAPFGLQDHMHLEMHTEYREVASLEPLQVPKTYLHDLGYAIFLPSVQFQLNIETIPTVFSLLVPDSGVWYHVSIQDTAANPLSLLVQPDNRSKTFALLLTNLDYCNLGLMVETTGKRNDDDKMLGTWMFIVEIHEMKEGDKTNWAETAKHSRFKGHYAPFTWWIVD